MEMELTESMKQQLKKDLLQVSVEVDEMIETIDNNGCCILNDFERIHHVFNDLQMTAASHYLDTYLSPFTDAYQALSTAIRHFSKRKHGAIMVVQRKNPLDAFMHSGVLIGASVSFQLLETIFYPGSALHDGAVLIKSNTIVSAANVLPLSHKHVDEKIGTRHRAALGLSEKSDALILVVSEETGRASFAVGGKLYPIHPGGLI